PWGRDGRCKVGSWSPAHPSLYKRSGLRKLLRDKDVLSPAYSMAAHSPQSLGTTTTMVLECAVSGQPPPVVSWSLNGQSLSASERLRFEEGRNGTYCLHLQEVSVTDAGQYCCVATNVAGTAQAASELTVQPSTPKLYDKGGGTEKTEQWEEK
uniref:Ig-like domain-containing protein n=1 Tax=Cyanoderma ruficeps TaxID=181631 RepID=A0A8C3R766_9PASS